MPWLLTLVALVAMASPAAGAARLEIGIASGHPGERVSFEVRAYGAGIAGTQNDIRFDARTRVARRSEFRPDCRAGPELALSGPASSWRAAAYALIATQAWAKEQPLGLAFRPRGCTYGVDCDGLLVLALYSGGDPIPDGAVVYHCAVEIAVDAPPGTYPLVCDLPGASDTNGSPLATTCGDGAIVVVPLGEPAVPTWTPRPTSTALPTPTATIIRPPTRNPSPSPAPTACAPPCGSITVSDASGFPGELVPFSVRFTQGGVAISELIIAIRSAAVSFAEADSDIVRCLATEKAVTAAEFHLCLGRGVCARLTLSDEMPAEDVVLACEVEIDAGARPGRYPFEIVFAYGHDGPGRIDMRSQAGELLVRGAAAGGGGGCQVGPPTGCCTLAGWALVPVLLRGRKAISRGLRRRLRS